MYRRLDFKKDRLSILILATLIIDIVLFPIVVLITDSNNYVSFNSATSYSKLFSPGDRQIDPKDYMMFNDYTGKEIPAKKVLGNAEFERVSPYMYGVIMTLYKARARIGDLSLISSFSDLGEGHKEEIIALSQEGDFCSSGSIIIFNNKPYLLAHIKDDKDNKGEKGRSFSAAIKSFQTSENKDVCLFKIKNVDLKTIISSDGGPFSKKWFPNMFLLFPSVEYLYIMVFAVFILQVFMENVLYLFITYVRNKSRKSSNAVNM